MSEETSNHNSSHSSGAGHLIGANALGGGGTALGRPSALIVDDEPLLRAQLAETLRALWPELDLVGEAGHGAAAVELVAQMRPSIVFLDIEMPGMNGLQAAAQIKGLAHLVFITAYNQYALDAFDRGAIDYVLKPASEHRLAETVQRLKQRVAGPPPDAQRLMAALAEVATALGKRNNTQLQWIQASLGNQIRLIPVADVLYFQSDLKYTRVVTREGESLIRMTLRELLGQLDESQFWQIHRGTIVNSLAIAHALRDEDKLTLVLKEHSARLEVSRSFTHRFRSM